MNKHSQFRQGDVFLEFVGDIDQLPRHLQPVPRDQGRVVLALGESTGHAHAIADRNAELFTNAGTGERWLVIGASGTTIESGGGRATLLHEEHGAIVLEPGVYKVGKQKEYSPQAIRNVAD